MLLFWCITNEKHAFQFKYILFVAYYWIGLLLRDNPDCKIYCYVTKQPIAYKDQNYLSTDNYKNMLL